VNLGAPMPREGRVHEHRMNAAQNVHECAWWS
jgi:hypothetical protein